MKIDLLCHFEMDAGFPAHYEAAGFALHFALTPKDRNNLPADVAAKIRAVLTVGSIGLTAEQMDAMPKLEIICAQGVGFEQIDIAAARARNIQVTHGPGTNNSAVADHTLALMLAITRNIPDFDHRVRTGQWARSRIVTPGMFGKKLGIIGLGNIGMQIAHRCAGGFDMPVGYFNRRPVADSRYQYFDSRQSLARWADYLVVATPGGKETLNLIDAEVLRELGPRGYLINIARGTVVDTRAVIESLNNHTIAGAALDVLAGEPEVPEELVGITGNLVLTPHVAGRSPEAMSNMMKQVLENLNAHFSGQPVVTPVPA
ncbi:2-hydroxyacid dehydrogenase [Rouxiella badensis]|jgi:lactate dehydrogenase-like 2-hydroxyacid dehydrogenase|uniref:Hydroxyacid dehydrogenase n=1 Tax=Rouxiella badensis TaxID=1646377 RepID=A0A1X0WIS5_9GAMM|nr:2-hydroxyacid dehydrogenase [Rouxiella badensis]MCC3701690.1 2-hydroxyacid dehydrogenase [Rouxiella badensis]MCC3720122.1 2-hydroxyacid dehydrogenase [Rouxiella badensis]MCC3729785.1 2-hydroxyacid dehydrogenase [Rouxiella badensis]MCC3731332.1 2-hydroxyacid dehydrogenase [Rouxiella badensis]MCC3738267.1 2-hydroxyacid dehydrogenase [Rouxiella badensis]